MVAILDWRSASVLKDNAGLLERSGLTAKARSASGRPGAPHRSLVLRDDGSCELQRWTVGTAARRIGGSLPGIPEGKARMGNGG